MRGTLYGVGVGPGDPELLTLKAVRVLENCPVIAAPQTGSGEMLALNIARGAVNLEGKTIVPIPFPMVRDEARRQENYHRAARLAAGYLDRGLDVAMLTLGDVSIYATVHYLAQRLKGEGYQTVMVPGVPSFCAVAARLGVSLTGLDTPIHIIPAGWGPLEETLDLPGTKVLMKSGSQLPQVVRTLKEKGLLSRAAMVQSCGLPGERVCLNLEEPLSTDYFSTIVVKE